MNIKGLLIGIICLTGVIAQAETVVKMHRLPDEIIVDEKENTLNLKKSIRPDSFYEQTDSKMGSTYRQAYRSEVCFASVTQKPSEIGRMLNAKVRRYIKEITQFQVTRQDSFKIGKKLFFMNLESIPEQTTALLLAGHKESFIKIDVVCQTIPSLDQDANEKLTVQTAQKIAQTVMSVINEPQSVETKEK